MSNPTTANAVRHHVEVDVSGSCGIGGRLKVAATVHLPLAELIIEGATVVFALPGGGYGRGYYDMYFPGHRGYSQAEHHVSRGLVVVAIDHLGVGESTPAVCGDLRADDIAAANHAAVQRIAELLESGTAVAGYPPIRITRRIGVGQSMGGAITIIMAARHRTYQAIAVLGFSAVHTVLPFPDQLVTAEVAGRVGDSCRDADPRTQSVADAASRILDFLYPFFWEDVPGDIVTADTRGGYPLRREAPPFGSVTLPSCAIAMLSPGYVAEDAAAVDCPVFVGAGERDVLPTPRQEPAAYQNSSDITIFVTPQMAHMHNFASTRQMLWDRIVAWSQARI
jgi:pimeloyl-ACP methyl ester carboxylesterase